MKKLKPCGFNFHPIYTINSRYSIKVQEMTDLLTIPIILRSFPIFSSAQADSTIYSYRLKISQAVLYLGKLPDEFFN